MSKTIVIVNGAPGTGKTTLVRYLQTLIDAPVIEKDAIKEFFFDYIGHGDRETSRLLGKASIDAMFALARQLLNVSDVLILETAFYAELARADVMRLAEGYDVQYLELYCTVDETVRRQRFSERANTDRHPGHADLVAPDEATENLGRHVPLGLGSVITIDTASWTSETDGEALVGTIRNFITKGTL